MVKLYYIMISHDATDTKIFHPQAFVNRDHALIYAFYNLRHNVDDNYTIIVEETELSYVGGCVYYVEKTEVINSTNKNTSIKRQVSEIYPSIKLAKMDALWQDAIAFYDKNPEVEKYDLCDIVKSNLKGPAEELSSPGDFITAIQCIMVSK